MKKKRKKKNKLIIKIESTPGTVMKHEMGQVLPAFDPFIKGTIPDVGPPRLFEITATISAESPRLAMVALCKYYMDELVKETMTEEV